MKIKKVCALMMAGVLTCSVPAVTYAESNPIQAILENNFSSLFSDPDKIADVVLYVKGLLDSDSVTGDQISSLMHQAEEKFGIDFSDSEESAILRMIKEVKNFDVDETTLRSEISSAYQKLKDMGMDQEKAKGLFEIALDFVKNVF